MTSLLSTSNPVLLRNNSGSYSNNTLDRFLFLEDLIWQHIPFTLSAIK